MEAEGSGLSRVAATRTEARAGEQSAPGAVALRADRLRERSASRRRPASSAHGAISADAMCEEAMRSPIERAVSAVILRRKTRRGCKSTRGPCRDWTLPRQLRKNVRVVAICSTVRERSRNRDGVLRYGVGSTRLESQFTPRSRRHAFRTEEVEALNFDALEYLREKQHSKAHRLHQRDTGGTDILSVGSSS